jgi:hypothetical protein
MNDHGTAALFLDFLRERASSGATKVPQASAEIESALMAVAGVAGSPDQLVDAVDGLLDLLDGELWPGAIASLERLLHTALGAQWTPAVADRVRRASAYALRRRTRPPAPRASGSNRVRPRRRSTPRSPARVSSSSAPTSTPRAPAVTPVSTPRAPVECGSAPPFEVAVDRSSCGAFADLPMEELIVALWRSWWTGTVYFSQDESALEGSADFAVAFRNGVPVAIGANVQATAKGLIRAFGWRQGSFRRDAELLPPAGADEVMSPMALLIAGVVRGVPLGEVAQTMADCGVKHVAATTLASEDPGCAQLAAQCDGVVTMRELVSGAPDSAKALYGLYCAAVAHVVSFQDEPVEGLVPVSYVNVRPQGSESGPAPGMERRKAHATVLEVEHAYGLLSLKAGCGIARVSAAFMRSVGRGVGVQERAELASALDTVMAAEKALAEAAKAAAPISRSGAPPPPNTGALATASIARSSYNRGLASMRHGEPGKAVAYFGQAVEFEPECVEYRAGYYLAAVRAEPRRAAVTLRQVDEWLARLYQQGESARKDRSQVHLLCGRIHQAVGQVPEAQEQFLNAVNADRKNQEAASELRTSKMLHKPSARVKRALNTKVF